jgi:hypothetical protein
VVAPPPPPDEKLVIKIKRSTDADKRK